MDASVQKYRQSQTSRHNTREQSSRGISFGQPAFGGVNSIPDSKLTSLIQPSTPLMGEALAAYEGFLEITNPEYLSKLKVSAANGSLDEQSRFNLSVTVAENYFTRSDMKIREAIKQRFGIDASSMPMEDIMSDPRFAGDEVIRPLLEDAIRFSNDYKSHVERDFPQMKMEMAAKAARQAAVDAFHETNPVASTFLFGVVKPVAEFGGNLIAGAGSLPFRLLSLGESMPATIYSLATGTDLAAIPQSQRSIASREIGDAISNWANDKMDNWVAPSAYQGPMFENGRLANPTKILPSTVSGLYNLVFFAASGGVGGTTGLMAASTVLVYDDAYRQAKELGLDDRHADVFAATQAAVQSALELVSPNKLIGDAMVGSAFTGQFRRYITNGASRRTAFKMATKAWAAEVAEENLQEFAQLIGGKLTEYAFDQFVLQTPTFKPTVNVDEILETAFVTTLTTGLGTSRVFLSDGGMGRMIRDGYYDASQDIEGFDAFLNGLVERGKLTEDKRAEVSQMAAQYAEARTQLEESLEKEGKTMTDERKRSIVQMSVQLKNAYNQRSGIATIEEIQQRLDAIREGKAESGKTYFGNDVATVLNEMGVPSEVTQLASLLDYDGAEINLQELYEKDAEFRQMVDSISESRGTDAATDQEQAVPSVAVFDDAGNIMHGKEALAAAYASGATTATAYVGRTSVSAEERAKINAATRKANAPASAKYVENVVKKLKQHLGGVEVIYDQDMFDSVMAEQGVDGSNYRGVRMKADNKIYLNPSKVTKDTPIHEFSHIWVDLLKQQNPELYQKGIDMVARTIYARQAAEGGYGNGTVADMEVLEEALVQAIGEKGAQLFEDRENMSSWKQFWANLWESIKSTLGIGDGFDFESGTLDEFTTHMANRALFTARKADAKATIQIPPSSGFDYKRLAASSREDAVKMVQDARSRVQDQMNMSVLLHGSRHTAIDEAFRFQPVLEELAHIEQQLRDGVAPNAVKKWDGVTPVGMSENNNQLVYHGVSATIREEDGSWVLNVSNQDVARFESSADAKRNFAAFINGLRNFHNLDAQLVPRPKVTRTPDGEVRGDVPSSTRRFERYEQMIAEGKSESEAYEETRVFRDPTSDMLVEHLDTKSMQFKMPLTDETKEASMVGLQVQLQDVINYPALFERYPHFKYMPVKFVNMEEGTWGGYHTGDMDIKLPLPSSMKNTLGVESFSGGVDGLMAEAYSIITLEGTMIHEIQHAIQQYEGWSGGTSPQFALRVHLGKALEQYAAENPEAKQEFADMIKLHQLVEEINQYQWEGKSDDRIKEITGFAPNTILEVYEGMQNRIANEALRAEIIRSGVGERIINKGEPINGDTIGYEYYVANKGEIQARIAGMSHLSEKYYAVATGQDTTGSTSKDIILERLLEYGEITSPAEARKLPKDFDPRLTWSEGKNKILGVADVADLKALHDIASARSRVFNAQTVGNGKPHPDSFTYSEIEQRSIELSKKGVETLAKMYPEAVPPQLMTDKDGRYKFEVDKTTNQIKIKSDGSPALIPLKIEKYQLKNGLEEHHGVKLGRRYENFEEGAQKLADLILAEARVALVTPEAMAGFGWYGHFKETLYQMFGGNARVVAQVLGTTSPQTPVPNNYNYTMEFGNRLARGEYDKLIEDYTKHVQEVQAKYTDQYMEEYVRANDKTLLTKAAKKQKITEADIAKAVDKVDWRDLKKKDIRSFGESKNSNVVTRDNGKKFGLAKNSPLEVLFDQWFDFVDGPKTPNFAKNLVGESRNATIDLWAARFVRRVIYDGKVEQWRILPGQEDGVDFNYQAGTGMLIGDYGLAERAFGIAAETLGLEADDLQAILWFYEKMYWEKNGWADLRFGDFREEVERVPSARYIAGITTERPLTEIIYNDLQRIGDANPQLLETIAEELGLPADVGTISKSFKEALEDEAAARERGDEIKERSPIITTLIKHMGETSRDWMRTVFAEESRAIANEISNIDYAYGQGKVKAIKGGVVKEEGLTILAQGVTTSRVNATTGMFLGDGEPSMDVEFTAIGDADIQPVWSKVMEVAERYNQDSAYLSTVVAESHPNARPMASVYFGGKLTVEEQQTLIGIANKYFDGYTINTDFQGDMNGITSQFIPEFNGTSNQEEFDAGADKVKENTSLFVEEIKGTSLGTKLNFGDIVYVSTVVVKRGQYEQARKSNFKSESARGWAERKAAYDAQRVGGNNSTTTNQTGGFGTVSADANAARRTDMGGPTGRMVGQGNRGAEGETEGTTVGQQGVNFSGGENVSSLISQLLQVGAESKTIVTALREQFGYSLQEANNILNDYMKSNGRRRSGWESNSVARNKGNKDYRGVVADAADKNRTYYEQLNLLEEYDSVKEEISNMGGFDAPQTMAWLLDNTTTADLTRKQMARMQALQYFSDNFHTGSTDGTLSQPELDALIQNIEIVEKALANDATRAGQATVALRLWNAANGSTVIHRVEKMIKEYNARTRKLQRGFFGNLIGRRKHINEELTQEQKDRIREFMDGIGKQEAGSHLQLMLAQQMADYINKIVPTISAFDTFIALQYASLLSGYSTHALNILSAGFNLVTKPVRDLLNVSKWGRAITAAVRERRLQTFVDLFPLSGFMFGTRATGRGMSAGVTQFFDALVNGADSHKYIENHHTTAGVVRGARVSPLERNNGRAFRGKYNPANLAKYVGRLLAATDRFTFHTGYEREMFAAVKQAMFNTGLRGKDLTRAAQEIYLMKGVDMDAVNIAIEERIAAYENASTKKATKADIQKLRMEVLLKHYDEAAHAAIMQISEWKLKDMWRRDNSELLSAGLLTDDKFNADDYRTALINAAVSELNGERVKAERLAQSHIFTDDRGGAVAKLAGGIAGIVNRSATNAALLKPWIPFTKIVANVTEYMLDATPIYGQMRAAGLSPTGLLRRAALTPTSAQMSTEKDNVYYEQMGRAWLSTFAMAALGYFAAGGDEDDLIEVTGGAFYYNDPQRRQMTDNGRMPRYTIRIGKFKMNYMNLPGVAVPLAIMGSYNDTLKDADMSEDERALRLFHAVFNGFRSIQDLSFLKGVSDLIATMEDISTVSDESAIERINKQLVRTYGGFATRPLPQNFNLVRQTVKFFDPTSYSQKDLESIMGYALGIHYWTGRPNIDVLGGEVKTYPGETLMPYTHWVELKGKDKMWQFLSDYGAIPQALRNSSEHRTPSGYRKLEDDELYEYQKLTGKYFREYLEKYYGRLEGDSNRDMVIPRSGRDKTVVQLQVGKIWTAAHRKAFSDLINSGVIE